MDNHTERDIDNLEFTIYNLKQDYIKLKKEFEEYKNAMEYYFGSGRCHEALEQYRIENGQRDE